MSGPFILLGALLAGYLLGSIPFGLLLLKAAGRPDPRTIGSGNIGATNVARAGGRSIGAATLVLDAGKGVLAALIFSRLSPTAGALAGLGAVIGHCFTPWLRFRGGKGVATFLGIVSVLAWPWGLIAFVASWAATSYLTGVVAVASLVACAAAAWCGLPEGGMGPADVALLGALAIVLVRHRGNFATMRTARASRADNPDAPEVGA